MKKYRYFAIALFLTEIYIAAYVHDTIVRPYIGDLLVAILVYSTVKSFVNTPVLKTAVYTLLFCYLIEISQYFDLLGHIGLQNSRMAHIIMGYSFSWIDMLCYTIGIAIVLTVEAFIPKPITQTA
jgi:hypothetical protein